MATKYTEQEIQDYAAGTFSGNVQELEDYIKAYPVLEHLVNEYRLLYGAMKLEDEPALSFDLAEKMITNIEERKAAKDVLWSRVATAVSVLLFVSAFVFCFRYFSPALVAEQGLLIVSVLACLVFAIGFHFVDVRARAKKFAALS